MNIIDERPTLATDISFGECFYYLDELYMRCPRLESMFNSTMTSVIAVRLRDGFLATFEHKNVVNPVNATITVK